MTGRRKSERKRPDGSEVMKRSPPPHLGLRPTKFEFDVKKAYTTEQLTDIGAVALKWNQIEAHIDFIGSHILFPKSPFWLQIAVEKTISTNSKLRLLKEHVDQATLWNERTKSCVSSCLLQIEQCRGWRNGIIHHHVYDHAKGIGTYMDEGNSPYQVLVSPEALRILYGLLCSLLDELREIDLLFRIETDAQRPGRFDEKTGKFNYFDDEYLRKRIVPQHTKRIAAMQKSRKELQKLPLFPHADLLRALNAKEGEAS